jgi:hypothetical protein
MNDGIMQAQRQFKKQKKGRHAEPVRRHEEHPRVIFLRQRIAYERNSPLKLNVCKCGELCGSEKCWKCWTRELNARLENK